MVPPAARVRARRDAQETGMSWGLEASETEVNQTTSDGSSRPVIPPGMG